MTNTNRTATYELHVVFPCVRDGNTEWDAAPMTFEREGRTASEAFAAIPFAGGRLVSFRRLD